MPLRGEMQKLQLQDVIVKLLRIGKKRRLTLIECGNDMNMMIDIAKVADLVR